MTLGDDERREEALTRALFEAGGGPEAAGDPDMKRELDALREVERRLESAGREELEGLLREGRDPELELAARRSLQRILDSSPRRSDRPRVQWPWLVLTAAALLVVAWTVWVPRPDRPQDSITLGAGEIELVRPKGEVPEYGVFEWRGELPPDGSFVLRVWSADADPLAPPTLEETCRQPRWTPPDPDRLPDALRWEIVVRDAGGAPLARSEQRASRSGR